MEKAETNVKQKFSRKHNNQPGTTLPAATCGQPPRSVCLPTPGHQARWDFLVRLASWMGLVDTELPSAFRVFGLSVPSSLLVLPVGPFAYASPLVRLLLPHLLTTCLNLQSGLTQVSVGSK